MSLSHHGSIDGTPHLDGNSYSDKFNKPIFSMDNGVHWNYLAMLPNPLGVGFLYSLGGGELSVRDAVDSAVTPLSITGSTIELGYDSSSFQVVADQLALLTLAVTPGTYGSATKIAKVTVDSAGRTTDAEEIDLTVITDGTNSATVGGSGLDVLVGASTYAFSSAGLDMASQKITSLLTPTDATDAASKGYVDSMVQPVSWRTEVKAVADASVTLSAPQTIDGVALVAGDRVLCIAQADAKFNGIWTVDASAWTRPADFPVGDHAHRVCVMASAGNTHDNVGYICTSSVDDAKIDTDPQTWVQFASFNFKASTALSKSNETFSVLVDDSTISVNLNNQLQLKPVVGLAAGSYGTVTQIPTFTVNATGQVTTASDIDLAKLQNGADSVVSLTAVSTNITAKTSTYAFSEAGLYMDNQHITSLADPSAAQDAATKKYVDDQTTTSGVATTVNGTAVDVDVDNSTIGVSGADKLQIKNTGVTAATYGSNVKVVQLGVSATGQITSASELDLSKIALGGNSVTVANLAVTIVSGGSYAFSAAGLNMGSKAVSSLLDPTNDQDAATKKYVDDQALTNGVASAANGTAVDVQVDATTIEVNGSNKLALKAIAGLTAATYPLALSNDSANRIARVTVDSVGRVTLAEEKTLYYLEQGTTSLTVNNNNSIIAQASHNDVFRITSTTARAGILFQPTNVVNWGSGIHGALEAGGNVLNLAASGVGYGSPQLVIGAPAEITETSGSFVVGKIYEIVSTGNTNFVGEHPTAADDQPGTTFTAAVVGTGTGTAKRVGDTTTRNVSIDCPFLYAPQLRAKTTQTKMLYIDDTTGQVVKGDAVASDGILDGDGDTKILVENSADEDKIRMSVGNGSNVSTELAEIGYLDQATYPVSLFKSPNWIGLQSESPADYQLMLRGTQSRKSGFMMKGGDSTAIANASFQAETTIGGDSELRAAIWVPNSSMGTSATVQSWKISESQGIPRSDGAIVTIESTKEWTSATDSGLIVKSGAQIDKQLHVDGNTTANGQVYIPNMDDRFPNSVGSDTVVHWKSDGQLMYGGLWGIRNQDNTCRVTTTAFAFSGSLVEAYQGVQMWTKKTSESSATVKFTLDGDGAITQTTLTTTGSSMTSGGHITDKAAMSLQIGTEDIAENANLVYPYTFLECHALQVDHVDVADNVTSAGTNINENNLFGMGNIKFKTTQGGSGSLGGNPTMSTPVVAYIASGPDNFASNAAFQFGRISGTDNYQRSCLSFFTVPDNSGITGGMDQNAELTNRLALFLDSRGRMGVGGAKKLNAMIHIQSRHSDQGAGGTMSQNMSVPYIGFSGSADNHATNTFIGSIGRNGTSGVTFNTTSDYRLKTNVEPMTGALEEVLNLKPKRFHFVDDLDSKKTGGFLAHEVDVVGVVTGEKDDVDENGLPLYQQMDHSKLVPVLVGALHDLVAKCEALEARLAALEG